MYQRYSMSSIALTITCLLGLAGCSAQGGPSEGQNSLALVGDGTGDVRGDGVFPNDGTAGGMILDGGTVIVGPGAEPAAGFACARSAQLAQGSRVEVGVNGLVGDDLSGLVDTLGGQVVTTLLNSVVDAPLAIDGDLDSYASFHLTAAGLDILLGTGSVDSVDLNVLLPGAIPAGRYAVFAVSFPPGLLDLGMMSSVYVSTYLDDQLVDTGAVLDATGMSLLNMTMVGPDYAVIGYRARGSFDRATISVSSDLLSANAGEALRVHEMCSDGNIVPL